MIVYRATYNTINRKEEKAVELMKEFFALFPPPQGSRVYRNRIGPYNKLVVETEFENEAEAADYFGKNPLSPKNPEWMEKWDEVVAPGGGVEIWTLVG